MNNNGQRTPMMMRVARWRQAACARVLRVAAVNVLVVMLGLHAGKPFEIPAAVQAAASTSALSSSAHLSTSLTTTSTASAPELSDAGEAAKEQGSFHRHAFVVGQHHSGTTLFDLLLALNPNVTRLTDTGQAEDEGQHLQTVYSRARMIGGARRWFYHEEAHLTEADVQSAERTRKRLFNAWAPFWNLSRPILLEKSPRHTTMTRYLQHIFGSRTVFFVTMRHPLGATYHFYHRFKESKRTQYYRDCAELDIRAFLTVYDWLVQDLPFLNTVGIVALETLLDQRNTEAALHAAEHMLGLKPSIRVDPQNVPLDTEAYREEEAKPSVDPLPPPPIQPPTAMPGSLQPGMLDYKSSKHKGRRSESRRRRTLRGTDSADSLDHRASTTDSNGSDGTQSAVGDAAGPEYSERDAVWAVAWGALGGGLPGDETTATPTATTTSRRGHRGNSAQVGDGSAAPLKWGRRRLLHYHGDRDSVNVRTGPGAQFSWVDTFKQLQPDFQQRCAHVIDKYEARVNAYGYSLRKLTQHFLPSALYPYLLLPEAYPRDRINTLSERLHYQRHGAG